MVGPIYHSGGSTSLYDWLSEQLGSHSLETIIGFQTVYNKVFGEVYKDQKMSNAFFYSIFQVLHKSTSIDNIF